MKRGWAGSPIIRRKEAWSSLIKSEEDHAFLVACLQNSKLPPRHPISLHSDNDSLTPSYLSVAG
jgi:hypothetical protein